jgi:hypothetical protein
MIDAYMLHISMSFIAIPSLILTSLIYKSKEKI